MARPAPSAEQPQTHTRSVTLRAWPPATLPGGSLARVRGLASLVAQERVLLALVLLTTLVQGLLYTFLLPPWQHYDEPTHFEYAWLLANKTWSPHIGVDEDAPMRRAVAASMLEHNFYWNQSKPSLLSDYDEIWIGISEVNHPPAYYLLVALPLRLLRHVDVTTQLYAARAVSLLLFLLTIGVTIRLMQDLTAPGHLLRWAVPLTMVLLPPFADAMTSVNNDAGAVFVFSLFLWGCVRLIRRGLSVGRVLWVLGAALLAALTKNTASLALLLAPVALLAGVWQAARWRWRWLGASVLVGAALLALATLDWGDAAYWYRLSAGPAQNGTTQVAQPAAPVGAHALMLEATPGEAPRQLISPLLTDDVAQLAGKTITVGGWFWSDQPGVLPLPTVIYGTISVRNLQSTTQPVSVTTIPTFSAWTFQLPTDMRVLQYMLVANVLPGATTPRHIYCDGALIVAGAYPASVPPTFDDARARGGVWGGRRFENFVRNASAEQTWPHLRPWLEHALSRYLHRSPAQMVAALFDMQRNAGVLVTDVVTWVIYACFGVFAWGHVMLTGWAWRWLFPALALLALLGCGRWLARQWRGQLGSVTIALIFLGFVGLLVWTNTLLRPLPLLDARIFYPVARYGFPCIIPTALALIGGLWAPWPRRWRGYAVGVLVVGLIVLNIVAAQTIRSFYSSLPV